MRRTSSRRARPTTLPASGDSIEYFDIVALHDAADAGLVDRLGYKKIFTLGQDIELIKGDAGPTGAGKKAIVLAKGMHTVARYVRQRNVVGFVFEDSEVIKKALEEISENEKLVLLPMQWLMQSDQRSRLRSLGRMKKLLKTASKFRTRVAVVSMAQSRAYLLSRMQLAAMAGYLGAGEKQSGEMMNRLGALL